MLRTIKDKLRQEKYLEIYGIRNTDIRKFDKGAHTYNNLPKDIKDIKTLYSFKKKSKKPYFKGFLIKYI